MGCQHSKLACPQNQPQPPHSQPSHQKSKQNPKSKIYEQKQNFEVHQTKLKAKNVDFYQIKVCTNPNLSKPITKEASKDEALVVQAIQKLEAFQQDEKSKRRERGAKVNSRQQFEAYAVEIINYLAKSRKYYQQVLQKCSSQLSWKDKQDSNLLINRLIFQCLQAHSISANEVQRWVEEKSKLLRERSQRWVGWVKECRVGVDKEDVGQILHVFIEDLCSTSHTLRLKFALQYQLKQECMAMKEWERQLASFYAKLTP